MNFVELQVLVPEERVVDFYGALGRWIASEPGTATDGMGAVAEGRRRGRPRGRRNGSSRYAGIATYLGALNGDSSAVASFEDLEAAIGAELPASALTHRAWWANSERNSQARMWLEQGWRVDSVDLESRKVSFSRL